MTNHHRPDLLQIHHLPRRRHRRRDLHPLKHRRAAELSISQYPRRQQYRLEEKQEGDGDGASPLDFNQAKVVLEIVSGKGDEILFIFPIRLVQPVIEKHVGFQHLDRPHQSRPGADDDGNDKSYDCCIEPGGSKMYAASDCNGGYSRRDGDNESHDCLQPAVNRIKAS